MRTCAQVAALAAALFAAALLGELPALAFPQLYGLHAVAVAPLYAFAAAWCARAQGRLQPCAAALCLVGCGLGLMHPVMAVGAIVPAVLALAIRAAVRGADVRVLAAATAFGALGYPATLAGGLLLGSCVVAGASAVASAAALAALGCALGFLGALAGDAWAARRVCRFGERLAGRNASKR